MSNERHEDTFAKAKELSLNSFIEDELSCKPKKSAGWTRYNTCPACGPSQSEDSVRLGVHPDDRTWKCHSCGAKGSIIDAAMAIWECSNVEAVNRLLGISDRGPRKAAAAFDHEAFERARQERATLMRSAFVKLQAACQQFRNEPDCMAYLTKVRCLPERVVREAQERGMLGFMPANAARAKSAMVEAVGQPLLQQTGLWKPEKEVPGIAYRPLVFFMPGLTSAEFRVVGEPRKGWSKTLTMGQKEYPFWWEGTGSTCLIDEGFIDMLSAVALGFRGHIMGLPGCNNLRPEWLVKSAERYSISEYLIGLDNDVDDPNNPGQTWAQRISELLSERFLNHSIKAPKSGDINEILKAKVAQGYRYAA
ncbi:MAG: hypothetical protein E6R08_00815 [Nevskiaceae bacterium]|nr:MAG: hypothetical protein E6R08_00815 [Nevskiaceae bacterium]